MHWGVAVLQFLSQKFLKSSAFIYAAVSARILAFILFRCVICGEKMSIPSTSTISRFFIFHNFHICANLSWRGKFAAYKRKKYHKSARRPLRWLAWDQFALRLIEMHLYYWTRTIYTTCAAHFRINSVIRICPGFVFFLHISLSLHFIIRCAYK